MSVQVKHKVCLMYVLSLSETAHPQTLDILYSVHDGWGVAAQKGIEGNAIEAASTPCMDKIAREHNYRTLRASGTAVGLSEGLMGNSEVG